MKAKILFYPICSRCGLIVRSEVNWEFEYPTGQDKGIFSTNTIVQRITPQECSECGAAFEMIAFPSKLPFKGYHFIAPVDGDEIDTADLHDKITEGQKT